MSGILDRMAKRALGRLPSIQPLALPGRISAFAAPEAAMPIAEFLEVDAAVDGFDNAPNQRHRQTQGGNAPASARTAEPGSQEPTPATRPRRQTIEAPAEEHRQVHRQQNAVRASDAFTSLTSSHANESADQGNNRRSIRPTRREQASDGPASDSRPERSESAQSGQPREHLASRVIPGADINPRELTRQTPRLSQNAPAPAASQNTEIHISIGSIELRAPRTEPRPQPAPFKPRVTLNEFLRRKPEARS